MKNKKIVLFSIILVTIIGVMGTLGAIKLIKCNNNQKEMEEKIPQPEFPFGYDKLNDWQQELYDKLTVWQKNTFADPNYWTFEYRDTIDLGVERDVDGILLVIDLYKFNHENTYIFTAVYPDEKTTPCLDGPGQIPTGKAEKVIVKTRLDTLDEKEQFEIAEKKAEEIVKEIIDEDDTDIWKAAKIFSYLVRNATYDKEALEISHKDDVLTEEELKKIDLAHSAYGALINKKAVCAGLSMAYHLLAEKAGIYVLYVSSIEMEHAWNMVLIDGKFYTIDVTNKQFLQYKEGRADNVGSIELPHPEAHEYYYTRNCKDLEVFRYINTTLFYHYNEK